MPDIRPPQSYANVCLSFACQCFGNNRMCLGFVLVDRSVWLAEVLCPCSPRLGFVAVMRAGSERERVCVCV